MFEILDPLGRAIYPYLTEISTALVACSLVILGGDINTLLRRAIRNQHFIVRTLCFIGLNAFGYGLIIIKCTPLLRTQLSSLSPGVMVSLLTIGFIAIGMWAQRNRQM
ncbi:DUF3392 domain-containing protein [Vibrio maerlii]|uniref:DUF3392 domain-containing protein n=1 Tax=Vibrio maerlii TaxID=2231648 RepID=UPI000E3C0101|nr:DUF3392 domain-containing protein [Vibrio maerlii]